jgi:hypothetical protein
MMMTMLLMLMMMLVEAMPRLQTTCFNPDLAFDPLSCWLRIRISTPLIHKKPNLLRSSSSAPLFEPYTIPILLVLRPIPTLRTARKQNVATE